MTHPHIPTTKNIVITTHGEEILLSKKLHVRKGVKIKSNVNTLNIHLWHLAVNSMSAPFNEFEYNDYINE